MGEGASQGAPRRFSAGKREGVAPGIAIEADFGQQGFNLAGSHGFAALARAEGDVFGNGSGEEVSALHDHADGPSQGFRRQLAVIPAMEEDRALAWLGGASYQGQERGLS